MLRRSSREFLSRHIRLPWSVLLLLVAVAVVPSAGVLWFMSRALRTEAQSARVRLVEAYQGRLASAAASVRTSWRSRREAMEAQNELPSETFARALRVAGADGAIVLDARGAIVYPDVPRAPRVAPGEDREWRDARALEDAGDMPGAASGYAAAARAAATPDERARALRAQARGLARTGRREEALAVLLGPFSDPRLGGAIDSAGRLIVPDGLLMAVALAADPASPGHRAARERLLERLKSYGPPRLSASQRRFLYEELRAQWPECPALPELAAEELSARYAAAHEPAPFVEWLSPSVLPGVLELASPRGRVIALYREERVAAATQSLLDAMSSGGQPRIVLTPPGIGAAPGAVSSVTVGGELGDYRLAITAGGDDPFASAFDRTRTAYFWAAGLILATIVAGSLLAGRSLGREVRVARLRNDLIATVSHEMRTPVASMRVLLDNLIEGGVDERAHVAEYLELIRKENARLAALVESFLTFSRLERRRWTFARDPVRVDDVVNAAVDPLRERLHAPGCTMTIDVPAGLPAVPGDRDALTTAVGNLIENALKYSGDDKRIAVRARAAASGVRIDVEDNGIGFSRSEARRLFEPFYQADRRLSRTAGGCGLGLSIVKSIVDAHHGAIAARGEPGKGSTFSIVLPA